jgi:hypothetical protein
MRANRNGLLGGIAVLVLLIGAGLWLYSRREEEVTAPGPSITPTEPTQVVVNWPSSPSGNPTQTVIGPVPSGNPVSPPPVTPEPTTPEPTPEPTPITPEPTPEPTGNPPGGGGVVVVPPATGGSGFQIGYASDLGLLNLQWVGEESGKVQLRNVANVSGVRYLINRQRPWRDSLDGLRFSPERAYTIQAVVPDGGQSEKYWLRPGVHFAQTTFSLTT